MQRLSVLWAHEVDDHENYNEGNEDHACDFCELPHEQKSIAEDDEYCRDLVCAGKPAVRAGGKRDCGPETNRKRGNTLHT